MRKIKKFIATALFSALVMMQVMPTYAAELDTGGTEGDSTVEAYVDKDIYNVVLPTLADVDFTVDPQGLLYIADSSTYGTASGAIYFTHPVATTYEDSTFTVTSNGTDTLTPSDTLDGDTTYYLKDTSTDPVSYVSYTGITAADLPADGSSSDYENTIGTYTLYVVDVAAHNTYSDTSENMEIINKSSFAVDLNFAVATTVAGIDLVADGDLGTATDPSLALEITATSNADGATPVTEGILTSPYNAEKQALSDVDAGYAIVSHDTAEAFPVGTTTVEGAITGLFYAYLLDEETDETFSSMTYAISGACNDVTGWGTLGVDDGVSLGITWTINTYTEDVAPSIAVTSYAIAADTAEDVTVALGSGALVATDIASVTDGGVAIAAENYALTGTTLAFTSAYINTLLGDGTAAVDKDLAVVFNDGSDTSVTITLTSDITSAAPTAASVTYSKATPADAAFSPDLGLGDLAVTTISDILITTNDGTFSLNGTSGSSVVLSEYFAIDNVAHTATILSDTFCENLPIATYVVQIIFDDDPTEIATTSLIVVE